MTKLLTAFLCMAMLSLPLNAQASRDADRLAGLGQVWGFLKYYHPGVAGGRIDWDSVLVETVPRVAAARSAADYRVAIQGLLNAAGQVPPCATCVATYPDSMRINLDLRWMTGNTLLGDSIARQLQYIRDNRHRGPGRYVTFGPTALFAADTAFSAPADLPSEPLRLLALYRFWNAVNYYFPYKYINGGDWNDVLREFAPRVAAARDAADYHMTIAEMTARVHDTHVGTGSAVIGRELGPRLPAFHARWIEGRLVVWKLDAESAADSPLRAGDVITHVNGSSIADRRKQMEKYMSAGNPATLDRKLAPAVLRASSDSSTYTIDRAGRTLRVTAAMAPNAPPATPAARAVNELARMLPGNIGYVNMGDISPAQVDSAIAIVRGADGIVMDVRNYPRGTMHQFAAFFNPTRLPFVKFTSADPTYPGQFVWLQPVSTGKAGGNPDYYRGRVAILVDERTQSHAEFSVMALQTAPENKVIGSQTAGADGNITRLTLPGGIATLFTGLGVYYPDGRETQRIGIVPDIEVRPTIAGVRAGRDEVLERAIEYIRTGR